MMRTARAAIEGAAAAEAALAHTPGDLIIMHALIEQQEKATGNMEQWLSFDCSFHQAVLTATHNPFLTEVGKIIGDFFDSQAYPRRVCREPLCSKITQDHWRILEHIKDKEPDGARRRMYDHIKFPKEDKRRGKRL